jgi:predicted GNAT family acetyltransferase
MRKLLDGVTPFSFSRSGIGGTAGNSEGRYRRSRFDGNAPAKPGKTCRGTMLGETRNCVPIAVHHGSNIVIRMLDAIRDNKAQHRFEMDAGTDTAVAYYGLAPGVITFTHTEVPAALWGQGIGSRLVRGALEAARAQGLKVVPRCSFVSAYLGKHPEFSDLVR